MKHFNLRNMIFLSLCADLGLVAKRIISPLTNLLTDSLHIPGGIGTSFSLMFLVIAVVLIPHFGCGMLVGITQSVIAICLGMVGSMGVLSPIGYIMPGITVDMVILLGRKSKLCLEVKMALANLLASVCAALTANCIVFRLRGIVLLLYLSVSMTSGVLCGLLGAQVAKLLLPALKHDASPVQRSEFV